MSSLPWFKCNPRDFRDGLIGLTPEERGIYATILMLIYERGSPVPEEEGWICAHLGCSSRVWKKVRAALIVKGKLFAVSFNGADSLMNRRAAEEIDSQKKLRERLSAGGKRPREKDADESKNNHLVAAELELCTEKTPEEKESRDRDIPPVVPQGGRARKKPSVPIPDGFPDAESISKAITKAKDAGADVDVAYQAERFRNWALGGGKLYADWVATFNNWIIRTIKEAPKRPSLTVVASNEDTPEDWRRRMGLWMKSRYWRDMDWGPRPGKPDCKVAQEIIDEFTPPIGGLFGETS